MWSPKQVIGTVIVSIGALLMAIGVPCWSIGSQTPHFLTSNVLVSLPIFPTTADELSYWRAVDPGNSGEVFPDTKSGKISFTLNSKFLEIFSKNIDFYLLHNVHGISTNITITDLIGQSICKYEEHFNNVIGGMPNVTNSFQSMTEFPAEFNKYGSYIVYCPYRTMITDKKGIPKSCKKDHGTFLEIHEKMSSRMMCSGKFNKIETPLTVRIEYLDVVPNDFIHTPQIYLGAWKKSNSYELIHVGSVTTTFGIICIICSIIIFFSMMLEQSQ
jgi:multisubunit Na+/H+ antiporter MnhG subunit